MDWNGMVNFLNENRGLIIKTVRKYGFSDYECTAEIEEAYYEAIKTYDPTRTCHYTLNTHFTQILKSKLKSKLLSKKREILFDDLFTCSDNNGDNGDNFAYDENLSRVRLRKTMCAIMIAPEDNVYNRMKKIVAEMCKQNRHKAQNALVFLKHGCLDEAIKEMPECETEIREFYTILLEKRNRRNN